METEAVSHWGVSNMRVQHAVLERVSTPESTSLVHTCAHGWVVILLWLVCSSANLR